ncbi:hypothetical protein NP493_265g03056 [Ridgeia piscesae]|uniref:Uncharacterized protein n=1 Tax=Ridgeia piscesae TaxID=27915 RepID=A0AAD9UCP3_RIDPI|nr:hypothetical protein NP493_265g03056 [Ridgeia piscesae]
MIVYINVHSKSCSYCFHISAWSALYYVVDDHISDCVCLSLSCLSASQCLSVVSVSVCVSVCWVLIGRVRVRQRLLRVPRWYPLLTSSRHLSHTSCHTFAECQSNIPAYHGAL